MQVTLESSPMFYAPGFLAWLRRMFNTGDKARAALMLSQTWQGINPDTATALLDGSISYEIKGDNVVFRSESDG